MEGLRETAASILSGERFRESVGHLAGRPRMQVARGRRDARVAHGRFDRREVDAAGDEERAVRVAEIVEPKRTQAGGLAGSLDAAAERGRVESPAEAVDEDEVVGAREVAAL